MGLFVDRVARWFADRTPPEPGWEVLDDYKEDGVPSQQPDKAIKGPWGHHLSADESIDLIDMITGGAATARLAEREAAHQERLRREQLGRVTLVGPEEEVV